MSKKKKSYPAYGTAGVTTTTYTPVAKTKEMDKSFDFSILKDKKFIMSDTLQAVETNNITDDVIKTGIAKTLIMTGNGIYEYSISNFGYAVQKAQGVGTFNGLGPAYPALADGMFITHNNYEKIPRKALETVLEWYRRVQADTGEEAQVIFYHNEFGRTVVNDELGNEVEITSIPGVKYWTDKLFSYTPKQWNSHTLTEVANDHYYDEFNRVFGMYVETHSHNSMAAFASGTDIDNSGNDGFQLVFGHFGTDTVEMYSWATASQVVKEGLSPTDLDFIVEKNPQATWREADCKYDIPVSSFDFDESVFETWDKQIEIRPVTTYATTVNAYGTGYYTGSESASSWYSKWYGNGYGGGTYKAPLEVDTIEEIFDEIKWDGYPNITVTPESLWAVMTDIFQMAYAERKNNPVYPSRLEGTQKLFENRIRGYAEQIKGIIDDAYDQVSK